MRFLGNIEAKTDAKGRAFLPATFRKVLQASGEENLVLRKDVFQKCLVLYPESVWNGRLDLLKSQLRLWKHDHQQIFRQFLRQLCQCSLRRGLERFAREEIAAGVTGQIQFGEGEDLDTFLVSFAGCGQDLFLIEGNVRDFDNGTCHFDSPKIHGISLFILRVPHSAGFHKYDYTLCDANLKEKAL